MVPGTHPVGSQPHVSPASRESDTLLDLQGYSKITQQTVTQTHILKIKILNNSDNNKEMDHWIRILAALAETMNSVSSTLW